MGRRSVSDKVWDEVWDEVYDEDQNVPDDGVYPRKEPSQSSGLAARIYSEHCWPKRTFSDRV